MVENAEAKFTLNKKIKDEKFDIEYLARYDLILQVREGFFRTCIIDSETERCLYFDDYHLQKVSGADEYLEQLSMIYDDHHLLQAGFWRSITLSIKSFDFSLVPKPLFEPLNSKNYLSLNSSSDFRQEDIFHSEIDKAGAVCVYPAEHKVIDFFKNRYPGKEVKVTHDTVSFIEGILDQYSSTEGKKQLFLNINRDYFTAVVTKDQSLEFCNNFYFSTTEDFVYFVMFVFDQLGLNPEETIVTIWGEITPDSSVFSKLYKYVRNVSFGVKPTSLQFGYQFDELFDHRFFDIYSVHFCQ